MRSTLTSKMWTLQILAPPLQLPEGGNQPCKHGWSLEPGRAVGEQPTEGPLAGRAGDGGAGSCDSRLHRGRAPRATQPGPHQHPAPPSATQPSLSTGTQGRPPPREKGHCSSAWTCMSPSGCVTENWTSSSYLQPRGWMSRGLEGAGLPPCPHKSRGHAAQREPGPGAASCREAAAARHSLMAKREGQLGIPWGAAAGVGMRCTSSAPSSRQDTSWTRTEQALKNPALFKNLRCINSISAASAVKSRSTREPESLNLGSRADPAFRSGTSAPVQDSHAAAVSPFSRRNKRALDPAPNRALAPEAAVGFPSVPATSFHICAIKTPEVQGVFLKPPYSPQPEREIPSLDAGMEPASQCPPGSGCGAGSGAGAGGGGGMPGEPGRPSCRSLH
ncbi:uncharacterized protein LOC121087249 [Falco naumanni]|uniref:uncharacterized protein LOC121087249 n=1 Tax=Falco naumanni TaxID=148594 RepID=UPI001ADE6D3C|nr:uncharacterized protein LOC121087249 [Falco naumanni]